MKSDDISGLLRQKRLEKGLSLSRLARLVGTSSATLSRYENGWQRFEIYTLKKIATALGCRLKIEFEPFTKEDLSLSRKEFVNQTGRLFWDKPLTEEDMDKYPKWVIQRVLELGNMKDVKNLIQVTGKDKFLTTVADIRFASAKTDHFWSAILEKEKTTCTRKSFRQTAGSY